MLAEQVRLGDCQGEGVSQNKHRAADTETLSDIMLTTINADEVPGLFLPLNACEAIQLLMDNQQFSHTG